MRVARQDRFDDCSVGLMRDVVPGAGGRQKRARRPPVRADQVGPCGLPAHESLARPFLVIEGQRRD